MVPTACPPFSAMERCPPALLQAQQDTPVLMSLFDRSDMLQWANHAFRQAYGLETDQRMSWSDLMRHNHQIGAGALIRTNDIDVWLASARSRRGKQAFRAFECDLQDGRWLWMTETVCADGAMLCVACDITHLRHDDRHLRQERDHAVRAAQTDALTGISNRAHILSQLDQQVQRARSQHLRCGVALLDLDHFKQINDRYGHAAGDTVLQHFAHLLRQMLRREDCFGRIGGEEFLLLLPDACTQTLPATLHRLLAMLPLQRPLESLPDFFYTCSAGIALIHPSDTAAGVLHRADTALYAAKAAGRHRLEWAATPAG